MTKLKRALGDHVETYQDGEVIVDEADEGREMYVIQEGEVLVTKSIEGGEVALARLGRGKFFGEMSLLESMPRNATARAVGKTRVLVVKPGGLLLKIRRNPTFAFEMLQNMSGRLREMNERIVRLLSEGEVSETTSQALRSMQASMVHADASEEEETT